MPKRGRFTQADIIRAIKAFTNAGLQLGSVKIELDGTIVLIAAAAEETDAGEADWRKGSPLYAPREEDNPRAFSVRTLADHWQCSAGLIRKMIARGELRSFRHGNLIRITAEAVAEVEARREPVT